MTIDDRLSYFVCICMQGWEDPSMYVVIVMVVLGGDNDGVDESQY